MKNITLIKFGGSIITNKNQEETARLKNIDQLSSQIKEIREIRNDVPFLIGNGGGSFGHIQVHKYALQDGIVTNAQKLGFSIVTHLVAHLNALVVSSLLKYKIPAIAIHPSSIAISSAKKLKTMFIGPIISALEMGISPVVYGDMIFDSVKGAVVQSTDIIFYEIIKLLQKSGIGIEQVIFCGNTCGVLDLQGDTISHMNHSFYASMPSIFFKNQNIDVTGGMQKKVEVALDIAELGVKSYIIHGNDLKNCLLGKKFSGTAIV